MQALRHYNIDAREVSFIQTGGAPETLAALIAQGIDAAVLTVPTDAQALKLGYHYIIYGPDLRIAYAALTFNTRRSIMAKRGPVIGRFMRACNIFGLASLRGMQWCAAALQCSVRFTQR